MSNQSNAADEGAHVGRMVAVRNAFFLLLTPPSDAYILLE
jgi:hypothetical protein